MYCHRQKFFLNNVEGVYFPQNFSKNLQSSAGASDSDMAAATWQGQSAATCVCTRLLLLSVWPNLL